MRDTKERILLAALRLFARGGYEAVPVSAIAAEVGITKGALYRHYRNKRDIFDHILLRMERRDAERAREYGVPDGTEGEMPAAYRDSSMEKVVAYSKAQFRYWTQDEFAAQFRKMLTVEQYRGGEMGRLYQQYLASGPMGYLADLFRGMGIPEPRRRAAEFYAPMFLLYSVYDAARDKESVLSMADDCLEGFRSLQTQADQQKRGNL